MLKQFFVPSSANNYTPHLLHKRSMFVYLVIILLINIVFAHLPVSQAKAAVDAASLYELHNNERKTRGLSELRINSDLIESATAKAKAMLQSNCWSHYCPDGKSPWNFFDDSGYYYVYAGENLGEGFGDNYSVMNAWMNSPTHRENVLKPEFDEIGIGFASGTFQNIENNTIVVVHFGSRIEKLAALPESIQPSEAETVKILSPADGASLNNGNFEINGETSVGSQVQISANNNNLGRVNADGSNFTFRTPGTLKDGEYDLKASAMEGTKILAVSKPVSISIDSQEPEIIPASIRVNSIGYGKDEYIVLTLQTTDNASSVESANFSLTLSKIADNTWEGEILKSELAGKSNLLLETSDQAGNSSEYETPTSTIISKAQQIEEQLPSGNATSLTNILQVFSSRDLKDKLNLTFLGGLTFLFGIDFYVLGKSGLTGIERSRSHLHLSGFIIIILVLILGGFSGSILTGASQGI